MTSSKHCTLFLISLLLSVAYANDGFVVVKGAEFDANSIPETHIADLISHMSGSFMREDVDRTNFPKVDVFFRYQKQTYSLYSMLSLKI